MSRRTTPTCLLAFALASALSAPARADDEAASTELFNAGRDLMRRGDYSAACPKLAESIRLKPTVGALAKLAACEEHERRLVSARARWQQALNLARSVGDTRADEVSAELARIERIVPKLTIGAAGSLPPEASIRVDDLQVGAASLGVPLAVEPGRHTVTVTAPKKKTWSTSVETKPDGATTPLTIPDLEDAPAEVPPPPPPAQRPLTTGTPAPASSPPTSTGLEPRPVADAHGGATQRTVGVLTAGAGAVALGVGVFFGVDATRKRNDAGCTGTVCASDGGASTLGDAKSAANASTVLFVAGGALVAAGVTLWLIAPRSSNGANGQAVSTARLEAAPGPGGIVIRGIW